MDTMENTRVESRFAGSDANPYLAMAATLACGLLGMREELKATAPLASSAQDVGFELPRSLGESLDELETCKPLQELLGPVSYTHLDVYKRQSSPSAKSASTPTAGRTR